MSKQLKKSGDAYSITDAHEGHTDEMHHRMVKYSFTMGLRLVLFLAAFLVSGWLQWAFLAAAVFLPWIAVIIANGGSDQSKFEQSTALLDTAPRAELPATPEMVWAADDGVTLEGELVADEDDADASAPDNRADPDKRKTPPAA